MIAKFVLHEEINLEDIIRALFPLTCGIYWFVSAYAVLIVLSPFLNKFIHLGIFCVISTFFFWGHDILSNGSDFVWFVFKFDRCFYCNFYTFLNQMIIGL